MKCIGRGRALGLISAMAMMVLAAPLVLAAPASADPWPWQEWDPYSQSWYVAPRPDKGNHSYCWAPGYVPGGTVQAQTTGAMQNLDIQTDVTQVFHGSCTASTDVRVRQQWIDGSTLGDTTCAVTNPSSGYCDRWRVRINFDLLDSASSNTTNAVRHTVCHEIGHTVGLTHYASGGTPPDGAGNHSCMRSGIWDSGALVYRTYGAHHIGHINAWF